MIFKAKLTHPDKYPVIAILDTEKIAPGPYHRTHCEAGGLDVDLRCQWGKRPRHRWDLPAQDGQTNGRGAQEA